MSQVGDRYKKLAKARHDLNTRRKEYGSGTVQAAVYDTQQTEKLASLTKQFYRPCPQCRLLAGILIYRAPLAMKSHLENHRIYRALQDEESFIAYIAEQQRAHMKKLKKINTDRDGQGHKKKRRFLVSKRIQGLGGTW